MMITLNKLRITDNWATKALFSESGAVERSGVRPRNTKQSSR